MFLKSYIAVIIKYNFNVIYILLHLKSILIFRYIIVVEHDLSVLDYLSDFICCLYGVPSAYGVVTMPFSVREGNLQNCFHNAVSSLF